MMRVEFIKAVASGNDFVVTTASGVSRLPKRKLSRLAQAVCERRWGVGSDGLLILGPSKKGDFRMRVFNPDGSEAEMCGNGIRCAARVWSSEFFRKGTLRIETLAGVQEASVRGALVSVRMAAPKGLRSGIALRYQGKRCLLHSVDTGVPHAVFFTNRLARVDMQTFGEYVRYHRLFRPRGTNVNAVELTGPREISIRTYERGVEAETLACGTGSVASAVISALVKGMKSPVRVRTAGDDILTIGFRRDDKSFLEVTMTGTAEIIYRGRLLYV